MQNIQFFNRKFIRKDCKNNFLVPSFILNLIFGTINFNADEIDENSKKIFINDLLINIIFDSNYYINNLLNKENCHDEISFGGRIFFKKNFYLVCLESIRKLTTQEIQLDTEIYNDFYRNTINVLTYDSSTADKLFLRLANSFILTKDGNLTNFKRLNHEILNKILKILNENMKKRKILKKCSNILKILMRRGEHLDWFLRKRLIFLRLLKSSNKEQIDWIMDICKYFFMELMINQLNENDIFIQSFKSMDLTKFSSDRIDEIKILLSYTNYLFSIKNLIYYINNMELRRDDDCSIYLDENYLKFQFQDDLSLSESFLRITKSLKENPYPIVIKKNLNNSIINEILKFFKNSHDFNFFNSNNQLTIQFVHIIMIYAWLTQISPDISRFFIEKGYANFIISKILKHSIFSVENLILVKKHSWIDFEKLLLCLLGYYLIILNILVHHAKYDIISKTLDFLMDLEEKELFLEKNLTGKYIIYSRQIISTLRLFIYEYNDISQPDFDEKIENTFYEMIVNNNLRFNLNTNFISTHFKFKIIHILCKHTIYQEILFKILPYLFQYFSSFLKINGEIKKMAAECLLLATNYDNCKEFIKKEENIHALLLNSGRFENVREIVKKILINIKY